MRIIHLDDILLSRALLIDMPNGKANRIQLQEVVIERFTLSMSGGKLDISVRL